MNKINETIDPVIVSILKLKDDFHKAVKAIIIPYCKSIIPDGVEAFRVSAYTPYFADGDECVYSVREIFFKRTPKFNSIEVGSDIVITALNTKAVVKYIDGSTAIIKLNNSKEMIIPLSEIHLTDNADSDGFEEAYGLSNDLQEKISKLEKAVHSIPEDFIKNVFGDHVTITVTRTNFSVAPCDHE